MRLKCLTSSICFLPSITVFKYIIYHEYCINILNIKSIQINNYNNNISLHINNNNILIILHINIIWWINIMAWVIVVIYRRNRWLYTVFMQWWIAWRLWRHISWYRRWKLVVLKLSFIVCSRRGMYRTRRVHLVGVINWGPDSWGTSRRMIQWSVWGWRLLIELTAGPGCCTDWK